VDFQSYPYELKGNIMFRDKKKGFTLIELLVVIAIIAVLLAILMPSLKKVKMLGQRLVCNAHLKDMGKLMYLYSMQNDDKMVSGWPYGRRWYDLLGKLYGAQHKTSGDSGGNSMYDIEIFKCPSERVKFEKGENNAATGMYGYNPFFQCVGDDINGEFVGRPAYKHFWHSKLSKIAIASECPTFWEKSTDDSAWPVKGSGGGYPHMRLYNYGWDRSNPKSVANFMDGPAANHGPNFNVLFADGHAGGQGLWIYEDTMDKAETSSYYMRFFHPRKSKDWKTEVGDGWRW